jgi:hypothetical protein
MSYILDALTKAAKQRDRQAPVLQRLLAPAPTPRSAWTRSPRRLLAALVLNAGLLTVLLVSWLRPVPIAPPADSVGGPVRATSPPQQAPESEPQPTAEARGGKTPRRERAAIVDATRSPAVSKPTGSEPAPLKPHSTKALTPPAPPAVAPPVTPVEPPTPAVSGVRLEALIYSDVPAKRMIFINGRKYVEGDMIEDRLRIEEIQENGVALSEQGRRFTLPFAR